MLKIGVTQWFLDVEAGDSVARARELGFEYLHISSFAPNDKYYIGRTEVLQNYMSQIQSTGVNISGISLGAYEVLGIPKTFADFTSQPMHQVIIDTINAAIKLNSNLIYLPSFNLATIKNQNDLMATGKLLNIICQAAKQYDLCIASENTLDANDNAELLGQCDAVSLLLDTQNPLMHGHAIDTIIKRLGARLACQIHIKDGDMRTLGNARIGLGQCELRQTMRMLHNVAPEFTYIFENDYRQNAAANARADQLNFAQIMQEISYN
jgi:sugar phosphate isomerase/epimerase